MLAAEIGARKPFFIVIGAPKCGTTALAEAAASHPDVFLSKPKEPHFFDAHFGKGLDGFMRDHFAGSRPAHALGEATPSYLALPWVPQRIAATLPNARLIAVLRNPVERAFSSWWMFHARGMDRLAFADAIAENEKRLEENPLRDDEASRQAWSLHVDALASGKPIRIRTYLDSGYYARQLQRYFASFAREQVLVLFSDELRSDDEDVLRRVWRHIGVGDGAFSAHIAPANEAIGGGAARLLRLLQASGAMRLRGLMPESVRAGLKRFLSRRGDRPRLDEKLRLRLVAHFSPHVCELERLLEVDLTDWKR